MQINMTVQQKKTFYSSGNTETYMGKILHIVNLAFSLATHCQTSTKISEKGCHVSEIITYKLVISFPTHWCM